MTGQAYSYLVRGIASRGDAWVPVKGWAPDGNFDDMELQASCSAGPRTAEAEARRLLAESGLTGRVGIACTGDLVSFR